MSPPPTVLAGRFEMHEPIGSGGMATVYRGTDRVLGRTVAIKVLAPNYSADEAFVARFRREARSAARLSHPGVVGIYDTGSDDGTHYIVMEHVEGETLAEVLKREGKLGPDRAAGMAEQVAAALAFAHQKGVVHRDVKPANVMITPTGDVKVMDFGIARATTDETLTKTAFVLGTATYFSPEQAEGRPVDARSDIYSLGVVLYEMLTGEPPFRAGSAVAVAAKHVREALVPPSNLDPSVPAALEAVAMKALAKSQDLRYQSAEEMASAIAAASTDVTPSGTTSALPPEPTAVLTTTPPKRDGRRRAWIVAIIAAVVLGAIVGALIAAGDSDLRPAARHHTSSPTQSTSPPAESPPPSPETSSPPTIEEAFGSLSSIIASALASGGIDDHAGDELQRKLEEVAKELEDGDAEKAAEKVADMRDKLDEAVEKGEVPESVAARIASGIDALEAALAGSAEED